MFCSDWLNTLRYCNWLVFKSCDCLFLRHFSLINTFSDLLRECILQLFLQMHLTQLSKTNQIKKGNPAFNNIYIYVLNFIDTFEDINLMSSFKNLYFPTSLWNLWPQFLTQVSISWMKKEKKKKHYFLFSYQYFEFRVIIKSHMILS